MITSRGTLTIEETKSPAIAEMAEVAMKPKEGRKEEEEAEEAEGDFADAAVMWLLQTS